MMPFYNGGALTWGVNNLLMRGFAILPGSRLGRGFECCEEKVFL